MIRWMKRLGILCICLVIVALALPFVVPTAQYTHLVEQQLQQVLGRSVHIGDLQIALLPSPSIHAKQVKIGSPSWSKQDLVEIEDMTLNADWAPLLQKKVNIHALTLSSPTIHLQREGEKTNWDFTSSSQATETSQSAGTTSGQKIDIGIRTITVSHGSIVLQGKELASDINVTIQAPNIKEVIHVRGDALIKGQKTDFTLTLDRTKTTLAITGDIHLARLDITNSKEANKESGTQNDAASIPANEHWSSAPFSLAALSKFNASLKCSIDEVHVDRMTMHGIEFPLTIENGSLRAKTNEVAMYGGSLAVETHFQSNNTVGFAVFAKQLEIGPLLNDLSGSNHIDGKLTSTAAFGGHGNSLHAIIGTLGGHGDFSVTDGVIKGLNLATLATLTHIMHGDTPDAAVTAFSSLKGTFTIPNNGVVHNDDLLLTSSLLTAHGAGDIDLPNWQVRYTVRPQLLNTTLEVPVHIDGALNAPSVRVDAAPAIAETLKHPEQVKENLKQIKKNLLNKDALKQLLGR